jgi:hypothetical protein
MKPPFGGFLFALTVTELQEAGLRMERICVGKRYLVEWNRKDFEVVVHSRAIAEYNRWACKESDNQASIVLPSEAFKSISDNPQEVIPPASGPLVR